MKKLHQCNKIISNGHKWAIIEWWYNPEYIIIQNLTTGKTHKTTPQKVEQSAKENNCLIVIR